MRICLFVFLSAAGLAAGPAVVVSDTTWRASDRVPAGDAWLAAGFDDTAWKAATDYGMNEEKWVHYTVDNTFGFASEANWIWTQADRGGCLRKAFTATAGFRTAEMIFVADDTAEVWINGEPVDAYDTRVGWWGFRGCAVIVDVTPWIVDGDNVIAVRVHDTGGARGFAAEIRLDGEPLVLPLTRTVGDGDFQGAAGRDLLRFHRLGAAELKEQLAAAAAVQQVTVRLLAAAAQLRAKDPDGLAKLLRAGEDGTGALPERAVRYIGALELRDHQETLLEVLKARAGTRAGAFAAAALIRLGDAGAIPGLEAAAACGFAPTERAARRALEAVRARK